MLGSGVGIVLLAPHCASHRNVAAGLFLAGWAPKQQIL